MEMNQNIPIDLDYGKYGWGDHDREEGHSL